MLTGMGRGLCVLPAVIASAYLLALPLRGDTTTAKGLPARLSDQESCRLSSDLSEPDGTFRTTSSRTMRLEVID
jgi:hypothetical protein